MAAFREEGFPFADLALARRLERAEGTGNREFVEARARAFPETGACWIEVAGAYAMYDGVTSPCTQTFGLGLFDAVTAVELDVIERFFGDRGAPVFHEISPIADPALLTLLNERRYQPFELTSVLFRPIDRATVVSTGPMRVAARPIRPDENELWAETTAKGWEASELDEFMRGMALTQAARANAVSFLAEIDGRPIAAGGLSIHGGVALLAGASTIPEGRKQGAQLALLNARLTFAAEHGCDLAMMGALPGSASQRNAERHGFRIAYTRIKWRR